MEELRPMDEEEIQSYMHGIITEAIDYIDYDESPERTTAMRYYLGQRFRESEHTPQEIEGRSEYTSRDVMDAVHQLMPPIMRVLFSAENCVEFEPRQYDDIEFAKQATDYCTYLLRNRNNGYVLLDSVIKDALIKGVGISQVWYDERTETRIRELSGIDPQTAAAIMQQQQWEVLESSQGEDGMMAMKLRQVKREGNVMIDAVPPEELLVNRSAIDLESAKLVARRQRLTVSEIVAMGFDYDEVIELADSEDNYKSNEEWLLRNPSHREEEQSEHDPANREVLLIEAYVRADMDGDAQRELRKITCIGAAHQVVRNEVVDDHGFCVWRMDMLPHSWTGLSIYSLLRDVQSMKSATIRNVLDSLAMSTTPRMAYTEGQVEYNDIANSEVGALIPVRQPGAIQPLDVPFVGEKAMGMLDYMDKIKETRTGLTDASQGLDSANLQSTTAIAVDAQVKAAQSRTELIIRNLIETGVKPLFTKMLRLISYHQNQPDLMMLRGQYVPVDPTGWPMMQVRVSMPLGGADEQTKSSIILQLMEKQEALMQLLGPENSFAGLTQYHAALTRLMELNGLTEGQNYFGDPVAFLQQLEQQAAEAAQQPEPPTPEQMLAESQIQVKQLDVMARAASDAREDDRKRDQQMIDLFIECEKLKAANPGLQLNLTALMEELQRNRELEVVENRSITQRYQQAIESVSQQLAPQPQIQQPIN